MHQFIKYLSQFIELTEDEIVLTKDILLQKSYRKKAKLLMQGEISKEFFFVLKGCVRMYYTVEGEEKTTFFYTENQFVSSYRSFTNQVSADHTFECMEECELIVITTETAFQLLSYSKNFDSLARIMMELELGIYQEIVASFITLSPEERYLKLLREKPDLIQRIPQYQLATYLGINAESLSRIKKRIAKKELS